MNKDSQGRDYDPEKLVRDEKFVREGFWDKLRTTAGKIPFSEDVVAAYYCAIDGATPLYVKAMLMGAIAYFITPVDVIPDFIPGLGFTDDASVLTAAFAAIGRHLTPGHRDKARNVLKRDRIPSKDTAANNPAENGPAADR